MDRILPMAYTPSCAPGEENIRVCPGFFFNNLNKNGIIPHFAPDLKGNGKKIKLLKLN